jgi:hypothetical protein
MAIRSRTAAAVVEAPTPRVPALMHPDVQSLLAVQADDLELYNLEDRLTALAPRLATLERERGKVAGQLDKARASIVGEEVRHREAATHVEANRALVDRSQRAYESVTSPKEVNAATAQLEQTKRMVDESEHEAAQVQGRINELRHHVSDLEKALADVEERQTSTRAEPSAMTQPGPSPHPCCPSTIACACASAPKLYFRCATSPAVRVTPRFQHSAALPWLPLGRWRCVKDAACCSMRGNDPR